MGILLRELARNIDFVLVLIIMHLSQFQKMLVFCKELGSFKRDLLAVHFVIG